MYFGTLKSALSVNVSNVPGWRTDRHIIVIESDDWGSIRMPSTEAFDTLRKTGVPVDTDHYNVYDSLESNDDLEMMQDLLRHYYDKSGRHPVITGVNVVANPDFDAMKRNSFAEYVYEPYTESCKHFPNHDRVYDLWKKGAKERLMVPVFHGREHLNVQFWLRALKSGNKSALAAFENGVTGIPLRGIDGELVPDFQAAFKIDSVKDLTYQAEVLKSGLALFRGLYGYDSTYFVPTNGPFNNSLESTLNECGVKYINTGKRQREPLGNDRYRVNTRFIGQRNDYGQIYITRNCFFEPAASGYERPENHDWINFCLKEIEIAFRWHKPAVISSHRVNYIGYLHPENRERNLVLLGSLLGHIMKLWPDVEFLTTMELGDLIGSSKQ